MSKNSKGSIDLGLKMPVIKQYPTPEQIMKISDRLDNFPPDSIGFTAVVADGIYFHIEKNTQRVIFDYDWDEETNCCFDLLCEVSSFIQPSYELFLKQNKIELRQYSEGSHYYNFVDLNKINHDLLMEWSNI